MTGEGWLDLDTPIQAGLQIIKVRLGYGKRVYLG